MTVLQKIIPAFEWLRNYKRNDIRGDLSAGAIVAVMLVPQGMAYAMLAGLPPVMGLYASTLPLIAYALFGTSRQLAVGPVAMMSLLVFAWVSPLAEPGSEEYIRLVLMLSLMVGAIQFAMGLFRLGFFINFFSHAVISGFTSAAAMVICLSQLSHLLGIKLLVQHSIFPLLAEAAQRVGEINLITLTIGVISLVVQLFLRKKVPRFPAPLLVLAGSTLLVYALRLDRWGVSIVGQVPKGLPAFSLPAFSVESFRLLFPLALTILFVGFMESISVAKTIAVREKYKIDSNQELKGLGLSNIVASFFFAYPVTGGFSRTAVNYEAGARTGLASVISAALIILVLFFFTPLFHYLPKCALASIVMVAVIGLIDVKEAKHLFRVKKADGWTLALTFAVTLAAGSEQGILIGMVFSLLVFIWRSSHPHTAELGYVEKEDVFRNIKRFPEVKTYPEALILRVDASLYFANMGFLDDRLRKSLIERPEVKWVIIDLSGVNDIDAVAIDALEEVIENYHEKGIQFLFAGMKGPVRDLVAKAGWEEKYGDRIKHPSIQHALQSIGLRR
jgi:SulP family sulfate permease